MPLHPWWNEFGTALAGPDDLGASAARDLASWVAGGRAPSVALIELRRHAEQGEAVALELEVDRPQDLEFPIKAKEPVAVIFPINGNQPRVLALRGDFPDPPHQNWTPAGTPASLCIDDRPWAEARLTTTPADLVRRIQLWLSKAASGELHEEARPPDPLFFKDPYSMVIPAQALADGDAPRELIGYVRPDNPRMIITQLEPTGQTGRPRFVVLALQASPQKMGRMRHAPTTLAELAAELMPCNVDILGELRTAIASWARSGDDNQRRLSARLAILVAFPVSAGRDKPVVDLRAFASFDAAGEVGTKLGVVGANTTGDGDKGYFAIIAADKTKSGDDVIIEPVEAHIAFDRNLAASVSRGALPDLRRVVLVGAGAIGSQMALDLAREGAFAWCVIDQDYLLPHNLARHSLLPWDTGAPKAQAVAGQLSALLGDRVPTAVCNVMAPAEAIKANVDKAFTDADVILDASASVAVSRYLADLENVSARRVCAFFNPAGTAVVVLAEGADRLLSMRDLEAQYHALHLSDPRLAAHLKADLPGLRYSGSCRSLTNRIPATRAALLSAIAAQGVRMALAEEGASIRIWSLTEIFETALIERLPSPVTRLTLSSWTLTYDQALLDSLSAIRNAKLPVETGGVLLGIIDVNRRAIHVVLGLSAPVDSRESVQAFERGVADLRGDVGRAVAASMHQLRYVGEWHSHPRGASPMPSGQDLDQLAWLRAELEAEGLPAVMAIAADSGTIAFLIAESAPPGCTA